jgi:enoyl-CoA hydratase/carnithine racemase
MTSTAPPTGYLDVQEVRDVAVVTLSRPDRLNALDVATRLGLSRVIRSLGSGEGVRGIVLTGAGRAFSAGVDLREVSDADEGGILAAVEVFHDITRAVLETQVPVIAAVNGLAVGGASEVTMCCDARIGAPAAEFFMPENGIGLTISNASSLLLRRLVGHHATRLVLGSARVGAEEALRIGLLDEVVDAEVLVERAVDQVLRWNPPGGATAAHLPLLRPLPSEIDAAMTRENAAAVLATRAGLAQAGIARFWEDKDRG